MKILHTSDWHLGKSLYDFSLLEDQSFFLDRLVELLVREPVDAVVIAGDIYDRPVPPASAVALYDSFLSRVAVELGIPVLAIAGNHDSAARLQFGSSLYRRSGYHITGSVDRTPFTVTLWDALGEVRFTLIPYLHMAEIRSLFPEERVQTFDDAWRVLLDHYRQGLDFSQRNIAVAHGFFSNLGGAAQGEPMLVSDSEISIGGMDVVDIRCLEGFDYAALGHLHAPQRCGDFARYSGSPLKYSLSEETQRKSLTVVELGEKGDVHTRTVTLPSLRDVRTVRGTMEELMEPSFHTCKQFDDYVFADIDGPECPWPMEKLRTLFSRLLGLRFTARPAADLLPLPELQASGRIAKLSTEDLFCRFYRDCTGQEIPREHLAVVRDVLLEPDEEVDA